MISFKKVVLALPFVLQFLYVLQGIFVFPFATGDAYSSWIFKGNILYLFGWQGFLDFLKDPNFYYIHAGYPILFPLLVSSIYRLVGGVQELAVLAIYPLLYLMMIVFLYRLLKPLLGEWWAYLAAFFWSTTPIIERHAGRFEAGFVDLPLSLVMLVSAVGLWRGVFSKNKLWLGVSAICLALGANLKYEGALWVVNLFLAGLLSLNKGQLRRLLVPVSVGILSIVPWLIVIKTQNFPLLYVANLNRLVEPSYWLRIGLIIRTFLNQVPLLSRWSLGLLALTILIALKLRRLRLSRSRLLGLAIAFQLVGYSLIFVVTPLDLAGQLESSFYRLLIQIWPLLLWLGLDQLKGKDEAKIAD